MAAAVSAGSAGSPRCRDDVPSSRTTEFRRTGRSARDGAPGDRSGFSAGFGTPAARAGLDAVPRLRRGDMHAVRRRDDRAAEARPLLPRLRHQAARFGDGIAHRSSGLWAPARPCARPTRASAPWARRAARLRRPSRSRRPRRRSATSPATRAPTRWPAKRRRTEVT